MEIQTQIQKTISMYSNQSAQNTSKLKNPFIADMLQNGVTFFL
jgi:hypothetical protein